MKKRVGESYTHQICLPMVKYFFEKCSNMYFLAKRSKRRHFWGVQEARKEEDLGPYIPAPEIRTYLCSFAERFMKIG